MSSAEPIIDEILDSLKAKYPDMKFSEKSPYREHIINFEYGQTAGKIAIVTWLKRAKETP